MSLRKLRQEAVRIKKQSITWYERSLVDNTFRLFGVNVKKEPTPYVFITVAIEGDNLPDDWRSSPNYYSYDELNAMLDRLSRVIDDEETVRFINLVKQKATELEAEKADKIGRRGRAKRGRSRN